MAEKQGVFARSDTTFAQYGSHKTHDRTAR